ncbi:AAA family ATPase [Pseudomonas syringae]|uniref:AAA family ATPase n=1 Tax=Pseudomonas syringae TaxID=317 RepID=UPI0016052743|nr:AAA family ATPase [Pseudomonas syringae]
MIVQKGVEPRAYTFHSVRLERVKFLGFQSPKRSAEVFFSKESSSIIYGDNGCGKTTFLKLLHALLSKDGSIFFKEGVISAEVDFTIDRGALISAKVERVEFKNKDGSDDSEMEVSYDWTELSDTLLSHSTSLSLGVERGVTTLASRIEVTDIIRYMQNPNIYRDFPRHKITEFAEGLALHLRKYQTVRHRNSRDEFSLDDQHIYLQNIKMSNIESLLLERYRIARNIATTKIQNALFDTLALAIEESEQGGSTIKSAPENFIESVLKSKERIIEALKDGTENNFKSRVIKELEHFKKKEDISLLNTKNPILRQLIVNMINELQIEKQLLSAINILVETFNEFLIEGKELEITKDELTVNVNGYHHSIDVLSSGERHMLTFLSLIVVAGRSKDFIIIDEPEISLNMKWQRSLLELLERLAPDTQIIVASHSPAIAKRHSGALVELKPQVVV